MNHLILFIDSLLHLFQLMHEFLMWIIIFGYYLFLQIWQLFLAQFSRFLFLEQLDFQSCYFLFTFTLLLLLLLLFVILWWIICCYTFTMVIRILFLSRILEVLIKETSFLIAICKLIFTSFANLSKILHMLEGFTWLLISLFISVLLILRSFLFNEIVYFF